MHIRTLFFAVGGIACLTIASYIVFAPYAKEALDARLVAFDNEQKQASQVFEGDIKESSIGGDPVQPPLVLPESKEKVPEKKEISPIKETIGDVSQSVPTSPLPIENTQPKVVTPPTSLPPAQSPKEPQYSMAVVSTHNTKEDCWTVVRGTVYNLTSYVPRHPGGEKKIIRLCGTDGTHAFLGQHEGDTKPEAALAKLKIGMLN